MKAFVFFALACALILSSCDEVASPDHEPPPADAWGPATFQVNAVYEEGATAYQLTMDENELLHFSPEWTASSALPFTFYDRYFQNYREIIILSPYPIRPNWFRASKPGCLDPGDSMTGIEFAVTTARKQGYKLIARLDEAYWQCLRNSPAPLYFSFQLMSPKPQPTARFSLQGFYNMERELLHLKAQPDEQGQWHATSTYQVFQQPGPRDFTVQLSKHPVLAHDYSLLRIGSSMQCLPHSVWIGLPGECLEQADWEVHANRNGKRFLLDVVVPDCFLECLQDVADGFEFQLDFFQ